MTKDDVNQAKNEAEHALLKAITHNINSLYKAEYLDDHERIARVIDALAEAYGRLNW